MPRQAVRWAQAREYEEVGQESVTGQSPAKDQRQRRAQSVDPIRDVLALGNNLHSRVQNQRRATLALTQKHESRARHWHVRHSAVAAGVLGYVVSAATACTVRPGASPLRFGQTTRTHGVCSRNETTRPPQQSQRFRMLNSFNVACARGFQLRYVMAGGGAAKAIAAAGVPGAGVMGPVGRGVYGTIACAAAATLVGAGAGGRADGNAGLVPGGTRATLALALGGALVVGHVGLGGRVAGGMAASLSIPLPGPTAILD